MIDPYEPLHQPPNASDLQQAPPDSPECARVRGLLRDFADLDLNQEHVTEVEGHVHACRTCALALARCEYEVLRIRRAFLSNWAAVEPRPGFARRAVGRILAARPEEGLEEGLREGLDKPSDVEGGAADGARIADHGFAEGSASEGTEAAPTAAASNGPPAASGAGDDHGEHSEVTSTERAGDGSRGRGGGMAAGNLRRGSRQGGLVAPERPVGRGRRSVLASPWLLVSTLGGALCLLIAGLVWQGAAEFAASVRLSVVTASGAWRELGRERHQLGSGDGLGNGDTLIVDRGGQAEAHWNDASMTGEQPAAELRMQGDSQLRVRDDLPELVHGAVDVTSQRAMSLRLADGSRVVLGAGQYHIDVVEQSRFDRQLSMARESLALSVEVRSGEDAVYESEGGASRRIAAGQIGSIRGISGFAVENLPTRSTGGTRAERPPLPDEPTPQVPDLVGAVLDRQQMGVPFSAVTMTYQALGGGLVTERLVCDANGEYRIGPNSGIREGFALVQVSPPAARPGLGFVVREAVRLQPTATGLRLPPVTLPDSPPLIGRVVDSQLVPHRLVRVVPVVYDELLGQVCPCLERSVFTEDNGSFVLTGLPAYLQQNQTLALVAFDAAHDAGFVPVSLPGTPAAQVDSIQIELQPLRHLTLRGLPVNTVCEVYEELTGMPSGSGLRIHSIPATVNGIAQDVEVGLGRLFLREPGSGTIQLRELRPAEGGVREVAGDPFDYATIFRADPSDMVAVRAAGPESVLIASDSRYRSFHRSNGTVQMFLLDAASNTRLQDAQLFAVSRRGQSLRSARFLGLQDVDGLAIDVDAGEVELLALGGGAVQWGAVQDLGTGGRVLRLPHPGSARLNLQQLPPRRTLAMRFEPLQPGPAGPRPALYRILCDAEGWIARDLPPGPYRVTDEQGRLFTINVLSDMTIEIR